MNFSFDVTNAQVSAAGSNYFKPYTINKINKIEAKYVNGEKEGKPWKALDMTFTGKDGSIRERYFIPVKDDGSFDDAKGMERYVTDKKAELPSSYEVLKQLAIHILGNYAPAQFEKFKKYVTKVKNMQQFLDGFVKLVNEAPENEIDLKVVGRNSSGKIYAKLPNTCGVSKNDDGSYSDTTFPINFLGKGLEFTAYEMQQADKMKNAKPTKMDDNIAESVDGGDDINLDDIDLGDELGDLSL